MISQLPFRYTGDGTDAVDGFPLKLAPEGGQEIGYGKFGLTLNELSASYLKNLALSNLDVVADFVLLDERIFEPYRVALADIPVLFVGVYCDNKILFERNKRRQDRATGLSINQQKKIHFCSASYDVRLDSSLLSSSELAASILSHLNQAAPTPGFI